APRDSTARVRRLYDRDAPRYDRNMGLTERLVGDRRRRLVADLSGDVLEVAVGTGATLPHYRPGTRVTGIDLSDEMLARAARRPHDEGVSVTLVQGDAQDLPLPSASFDAVVFTLCLCAIPDPKAAIREALRVLRPGGQVRMLEHVRSHLLPVALLLDAMNAVTVPLHEEHMNRRTAEIAREAGVQQLTEERWFLGIFTIIKGYAPA
ncbi:MAG: class I SAM-dependent methyltransferase, partial [Actinobacteria bacterium]|nr:class I SAM-dependent methyltransferase [Actinomycetota bacterium]